MTAPAPIRRVWRPLVPELIDAMVAEFTAQLPSLGPSLDGLGVLVVDGPQTGERAQTEVIGVGFNPTSEGTSAATTTSHEEGLVPSIRETTWVHCTATVAAGNAGIAAARRRAYDLAAGAGAICLRNSTLNGLVINLSPGTTATLHQDQDSRGALVIVAFEIEAEGYAQQ